MVLPKPVHRDRWLDETRLVATLVTTSDPSMRLQASKREQGVCDTGAGNSRVPPGVACGEAAPTTWTETTLRRGLHRCHQGSSIPPSLKRQEFHLRANLLPTEEIS